MTNKNSTEYTYMKKKKESKHITKDSHQRREEEKNKKDL